MGSLREREAETRQYRAGWYEKSRQAEERCPHREKQRDTQSPGRANTHSLTPLSCSLEAEERRSKEVTRAKYAGLLRGLPK